MELMDERRVGNRGAKTRGGKDGWRWIFSF